MHTQSECLWVLTVEDIQDALSIFWTKPQASGLDFHVEIVLDANCGLTVSLSHYTMLSRAVLQWLLMTG